MGVVRRYIDILTIIIHFPYSTCIRSFFGSIPSLIILKMFFRSLLYMNIPIAVRAAAISSFALGRVSLFLHTVKVVLYTQGLFS